MYKIYCYQNKINQKRYIGITKRSMRAREINHISEAYNENNKHYNYPFKQAIRKYGISNFTNTILEEVETFEEAKQREIYYIDYYNTYVYQDNSNGYNATRGGDNNGIISYPIVAINIYNGQLEKTYDSIATAESELQITHISECLHDKLPTSGGYCWLYQSDYEEMNAKELFDFVNIKNNRIVQLDMDMNLISIWNGATDAARNLNLSGDSNIVSAYKGNRKSAFGYIWRTYYDYINHITPIPKKQKLYKKDINNTVIQEYNTLREMARDNDFVEQTLGRHINKGLYRGYYWTRE